MKKRWIAVGMLAAIGMSLFGCSGKEVDVNALAGDLNSQIAYKDELSPIDLDTAQMFYSFSDADITDAVFYESSGATAEEVAVVKCGSKEGADKVETAINSRVSEQIESYTDYVPAELEKLNAAVVIRKGNTVVLSVSDEPDKAREIIGKY
ncbi:MAG: DUF4358 domain-containing protein [Lachnospiraceae bacterium]|nr:DUF4358 domain-containing protein [Lachnospiraceae bacterium]